MSDTLLKYIILENFTTESGVLYPKLSLSYQVFGQPVGTAPIVLVNHALTGNSQVAGNSGWWKDLIGDKQIINPAKYTIVCFNIPGNGFDGNLKNLIHSYKDFTVRDIATIFWLGLNAIDVKSLFAVIGGSLGGAIAWEMVAMQPEVVVNLIPIASDWKSSDWLIANTYVQDQIMKNSTDPVHDARIHAMLLYRTPQSFKQKFNREVNEELNLFQIESWLLHHGEKLKSRFQFAAYRLMNHLLRTIDITRGRGNFLSVAKKIKANIHIVAVDSDGFFSSYENLETYEELKKVKENVFYHEINSIHGHDAFLIEYNQLEAILKKTFQ